MKLLTTDILTIRWGIEIIEVQPYQDTVAGANDRIRVWVGMDEKTIHMKNVVAVNGVER